MRFLKRYTSIIIVLVLIATTQILRAQTIEPTQNEKPKIALVLSGGGAKGLAHIGVLTVLEEVGIRPDIITGTSMGSIMGALYAAGYTAEELSKINKNANWDILLTDAEDLTKVSIDEKQESKRYVFEIPVKGTKIYLPAGLIEGQHLESYFSELFWPLSNDQVFDSLPIPFRCVSVDLISGKAVVLNQGDLVQSIRASMSIPTVFSPIKKDSMLLVDGGVTRNFPVQEAIDMGADIIIGVYVGYQEDVIPEDLSSMTDILQRSIALAGIVDALKQYEKVDILIFPDLEPYGASDFTKGPDIEALGEKAARRHIQELKTLADKYKLTFEPVQKIDQPNKLLIENIEVNNLQYLNEDFIRVKSGIKPGDSLSYNELKESIEYMHGTRYVSKLTYSLQQNDSTGAYTLVFHVKENPPIMFKLAPHYANDLGVGMITNFTLRNVLTPASRLLFTANIAENPGLEFSFNKYMGENEHFNNNFYANTYGYKVKFFSDGDVLGRFKKTYFEGGYGLHYAPGLNHVIGADFFYKYGKIAPEADFRSIFPQADFDKYTINEWGYMGFYKMNTTNRLYFPTKGVKLRLSLEHAFKTHSTLEIEDPAGGDDDYFLKEIVDPFFNLSLDHDWYIPVAPKVTYNLGLGLGINTDDPGWNGYFLLGGPYWENKMSFKSFAGFSLGELIAQNYSAVRTGIQVELLPSLYFTGTANVGNLATSASDLLDNIGNYSIGDYHWGYNLGVQYDSVLGPIRVILMGNNKHDHIRFHVGIGYPF
jgi:NTE family protein